MKKVLIPTKLHTSAADMLRDNGFEVVQDQENSIADIVAAHPDAVGMIVRSEKVTAEIIDALPNLKGVVRAGAGYNTIDTKYAASKGVVVMNTPGANSNAVAEEVVGMMIASARHFIRGDKGVREGLWEKGKLMGFELTGKTVGIVGFGNIGQLLATRLKGFDMDLKVFDPYVSEDKAREFGADICSLEEIFAQCDFISLHIPATPETNKIVSTKLFGLMKDKAVLVNCARCEVLDEEALRQAQQSKTIYYANDVYPKDAAGEKSVCDVACITLPHLGASSIEANSNAAQMAARQIDDLLARGIDNHVVNRLVPDGFNTDYQRLANVLTQVAYSAVSDYASPRELQVTFYGELSKFEKYLVPPMAAALTSKGQVTDYSEALAVFEQQGIELKVREGDNSKNYGESITIDIIAGQSELKRVSVRGTVAEGNVIISRIGDFDKLYFDPVGSSAVFVYDDRPGVLAQITQAIAFENVNIEDVRSPHNKETKRSVAVLKLNKSIDAEFVAKLSDKLDCHSAFAITVKA